uniref:Uncharacterized protein n=1 Tax=Aureoumbra lagunensis TaxID=44058 RepID=A0A7S3JNP2_9STRA|mmetsp:Transcript_19229/g.29158  ORF Transcript_19229/g.29158 Transcript_19229/m.29158 type:complete len:951 (+) Transcript_19229:68-2920(+)
MNTSFSIVEDDEDEDAPFDSHSQEAIEEKDEERHYYVVNVSSQPIPLLGYPQDQVDIPEWAIVERLMPGKCAEVSRVCIFDGKVWIEISAGFTGPERNVGDKSCWLADDRRVQVIIDPWYNDTNDNVENLQACMTLYKAKQDATIYDAPRRTAILAGQVLRWQCARVRHQRLTYDPSANELWARLDEPREKWICISQVVHDDAAEPPMLIFEALDELRGEAYFLNVYSRHYAVGELPLREKPSLRAPKNATLPAYVVVRALSLRLVSSSDLFSTSTDSLINKQSAAVGTLWIEIAAPETVSGSACWCVQANAKSGLVVLEPLSSKIVQRHDPNKALFRNICSTQALPMFALDDFLQAATAPCNYPSSSSLTTPSLTSASMTFIDASKNNTLTMLSTFKARAQSKFEAASKTESVLAAKQRFQATVNATVAAAKRGVAARRRRSFSPESDPENSTLVQDSTKNIENPMLKQPPKVPLGTCIRARQVVLAPNGQLWAECEAPHSGEGFWAHALVDGAWTLKMIRNDDGRQALYRILEDVIVRTQPRGEDTGKVLHPGSAILGGRRQLDHRGELWIQLSSSDEWIAESAGGKHDSVQVIFQGIKVAELTEIEVKQLHQDISEKYHFRQESKSSLSSETITPPPTRQASPTINHDTIMEISSPEKKSPVPSEKNILSQSSGQLDLAALDEFAEASERAEKAQPQERDSALRACVTAAGLDQGYGLVADPPPPPVLKLVYKQEASCCFRSRSELFEQHAVLVFKVSSRDDRAVAAALHVLETGHTLEAPLVRQETKTRIRGIVLPKCCLFALEPNDLPENYLLDPQHASLTLHAVVLLDTLAAGRRTASKPTVLRHRPSPQSRFFTIFFCLYRRACTPFFSREITPQSRLSLPSTGRPKGGLTGGTKKHKYSRLDINDADDDLDDDDPAFFSEGEPSSIPRNLPTNYDLPRPGEF